MLIQLRYFALARVHGGRGGTQITGNPYGLADALRIDTMCKRVPLDANPATATCSSLTGNRLSLLATHNRSRAGLDNK